MSHQYAAMAEWTKASILKIEGPRGSVGSNPTRCATDEGEVNRQFTSQRISKLYNRN